MLRNFDPIGPTPEEIEAMNKPDPRTGQPHLFMPLTPSMINAQDDDRITTLSVAWRMETDLIGGVALLPYFTFFLWNVFDAHPEVFQKGIERSDLIDYLGLEFPDMTMANAVDAISQDSHGFGSKFMLHATGPGQFVQDLKDLKSQQEPQEMPWMHGGIANLKEYAEWEKNPPPIKWLPPKIAPEDWAYYPNDLERMREDFKKLKYIVGQMAGLPDPSKTEFTLLGWKKWKMENLRGSWKQRDYNIVHFMNKMENFMHPYDDAEMRRRRLIIKQDWIDRFNNGKPLA